MGNACCESTVEHNDFKHFCMEAAANNYKPYITSVQSRKISVDQKYPYNCQGNWQKNAPRTGSGVIFAEEKYYYEGRIVNGVAEGEGRIMWPNRFVYKGRVSGNKAEGQGQLKIEERGIAISGVWSDGYPKLNYQFELKRGYSKGSITFVGDENDTEESYFRKNVLQVKLDLGAGLTYEGELTKKNDNYQIEGNGTLWYSDSSYYTGQFVGGKFHGAGKYYWADRGHWFEGYYKGNLRDGIGRYYYSEEQYDVGCWVGGKLIKKTAETMKKAGNSMVRSGYNSRREEQFEPKQESKISQGQEGDVRQAPKEEEESRHEETPPKSQRRLNQNSPFANRQKLFDDDKRNTL